MLTVVYFSTKPPPFTSKKLGENGLLSKYLIR